MNLQGGWRSSIDLSAISGGLNFRGTWDAATNTPTLSDGGGGGAQGDYFIVSVAGATTIDGVSDWEVGDWIINSGSAWQKIDNTDLVQSVNGDTGVVIVDLESALAQNSSTGSYNISIDSGQNITWNAGLGGALTSAATTGSIKNWILPDLSGTIALTSQIPSTAIIDDRIPIGNAAGTGIEDGTWSIVGDDLIPLTDGSNIGSATNGIGTLYMSSTIDYGSALTWINSATTRLTLNTTGEFGIGVTPTTGDGQLQVLQPASSTKNAIYVDFNLASNAGARKAFSVVNTDSSYGGGAGAELFSIQKHNTSGYVFTRFRNVDGTNAVNISGSTSNTWFDQFVTIGRTSGNNANKLLIVGETSGTHFRTENSSGDQVLNVLDNGSVRLNLGQQFTGDFRVDGATAQNVLFVDASVNRVGVGSATPAYQLDVVKASASTTARFVSTVNGAIRIGNTTAGDEMTIGSTATGAFFRRVAGVNPMYIFSFRRENGAAVDGNIDKVTINPGAGGGLNLLTDTLSTAVTTTSNSQTLLLQSSYWTGAVRQVLSSTIQKVQVDTAGVNYLDIDDSIFLNKTGSTLNSVAIGTAPSSTLFRVDVTNNVVGIGVTPSTTSKLRVVTGTNRIGTWSASSRTDGEAIGMWGEAVAANTVGGNRGIYAAANNSTVSNYAIFIPVNNPTQSATNWAIRSESTAKSYLAGALGVGIATHDASALLDVASTTQGFLKPRMTAVQRDAIASPATGLEVYDTTANKATLFNGTAWKEISNRQYSEVDTTDATVITVDTIDIPDDNTSYYVKVYIALERDTNASGGVWELAVWITRRSGVTVVEDDTVIYQDDDAGGIGAGDITFAVSGSDVDIQVEGNGGQNFKWVSAWEVIVKSTN